MMKSTHLSAPQPGLLRTLPPLAALLAFERAAAHLSFRKAAEDLGLSASAISHQIRGLEARFGVRLFARSARAIRLTAVGARYLEAVATALRQLDVAGRDILSDAGEGGELRVSALPFFASTVMLPALGALEASCPGLVLRLEATHQYADFDASGVDVAIRYGRERATGLRFEPLIEVSGLPVCAPRLAGVFVAPENLAGAVLIHVSAQPNAWPSWLAAQGLADLMPRGALWVDSVPAALEAAEHGLGVTLAMHPLIQGRKGFGRILVAPFSPSAVMGRFHLVMRPEQARDRRIVAFRRWLRATLADVCSGQENLLAGGKAAVA